MILLRAQEVDHRLADFANALEAISGLPVAYVLDERKGEVPSHGRAKVSLTRRTCEGIGLFCPADFAWRCGDYGLYLARAQFPAVRHFWQIESDVRLAGHDRERFFSFFAPIETDFLATYVEAANRDWAWTRTIASRNRVAYKCFFPVVRVSAAAIDALHQKRREHSRNIARRMLWPNDEGFVATTLLGGGFGWSDINDFGQLFYSPDEFSFETICDGETARLTAGRVRLVHPVLFEEAIQHKLRRLDRRNKGSARWRRLWTRIDRAFGVDRLVGYHNQSRSW